MATCLQLLVSMKWSVLMLLILFSCSTQKKLSTEQGIQKQEENASHWLIDPFKFSCTRYPLTIDEMSAEFEKLTKAPCEVTMIDTEAGPVRSFECGDTTWFVTDSEATCQVAVGALKLPDSENSTWMLVPGQDSCEELQASLGQVVQGLEKETGTTCKVKQFSPEEKAARHIECGKKNWIVSEDEQTCQRLQMSYNQYQEHNI